MTLYILYTYMCVCLCVHACVCMCVLNTYSVKLHSWFQYVDHIFQKIMFWKKRKVCSYSELQRSNGPRRTLSLIKWSLQYYWGTSVVTVYSSPTHLVEQLWNDLSDLDHGISRFLAKSCCGPLDYGITTASFPRTWIGKYNLNHCVWFIFERRQIVIMVIEITL